MTKYAVTGATGKLGRLVLDELLQQANPSDIVALARDPAALSEYAQKKKFFQTNAERWFKL